MNDSPEVYIHLYYKPDPSLTANMAEEGGAIHDENGNTIGRWEFARDYIHLYYKPDPYTSQEDQICAVCGLPLDGLVVCCSDATYDDGTHDGAVCTDCCYHNKERAMR